MDSVRWIQSDEFRGTHIFVSEILIRRSSLARVRWKSDAFCGLVTVLTATQGSVQSCHMLDPSKSRKKPVLWGKGCALDLMSQLFSHKIHWSSDHLDLQIYSSSLLCKNTNTNAQPALRLCGNLFLPSLQFKMNFPAVFSFAQCFQRLWLRYDKTWWRITAFHLEFAAQEVTSLVACIRYSKKELWTSPVGNPFSRFSSCEERFKF